MDAAVALVARTDPPKEVGKRRRGVRKVLGFLEGFEGETWQQRWEAAALGAVSVAEAMGLKAQAATEIAKGVEALFVLRVVRPSLQELRANTARTLLRTFAATAADPLLDQYYDYLDALGAKPRMVFLAKIDVVSVLLTQDIGLSHLTPDALLYYSRECFTKQLVPDNRARGKGSQLAGVAAWDALFNLGFFPADTPPALRMRLTRGQLTTQQLVDRYQLKNQEVAQLLVEYLTRRDLDTDYGTRQLLATSLAKHFWKRIEEIAPDQKDLRLPSHVYDQWRATINLRDDGKPRLDVMPILLPVRALYLDLQSWAVEEPERWARWTAPCPIPQTDLRGFAQRRRRQKERMDDRTRVRQPLLPRLVAHVELRLDQTRSLLEAAEAVSPGRQFSLNGTHYERTDSDADRRNHATGNMTVRVRNMANGVVLDAKADEELAFWAWAYTEVLRQTGIRVEELVELSHTSVRQYQRPNGEVIAVLVIAPSKADRERVIPMSAELFHVIASLIKRQMDASRRIPAVARYDTTERQWTLPLPYLFQRQRFHQRRVVSTTTVVQTLAEACRSLGETDSSFAGVHFTPHDFRRLFATEVVNNGLPIHIGAALLGHLNLETTRGYVAVFDEDVVRHYQDFLARRRSQRPQEEYRAPTGEEWAEFEEHFEKRKLELGSCGRPYGTPCAHEHACIRCPMLQVNPKMLGRLAEIEADLEERRRRAEAEGWRGELEGIDQTLRFLLEKKAETERMSRPERQVNLGMPSLMPPG